MIRRWNARQMQGERGYVQSMIGLVVVQAHGTGCARTCRILGTEVLRRADREARDKAEKYDSYRESLSVVVHTHTSTPDGVTYPD
jgi:hypothetical protein